MPGVKTVTELMAGRGIDLPKLVELTGLDRRVVEAIVGFRYTPSPDDRRRIAAALGAEPGEVAWGHSAQVQHVQGHGPQFGRSP
jgi:hypothetical protein